jgi:hypothetical protein
MSWSVTYQAKNRDLTDESEKQLEEWLQGPVDAMSDEAKEQIVNTMLVAMGLIDSGVVGDPNGYYSVTLSGHANPEHKKTSGWANDYVALSIYQKDEE